MGGREVDKGKARGGRHPARNPPLLQLVPLPHAPLPSAKQPQPSRRCCLHPLLSPPTRLSRPLPSPTPNSCRCHLPRRPQPNTPAQPLPAAVARYRRQLPSPAAVATNATQQTTALADTQPAFRCRCCFNSCRCRSPRHTQPPNPSPTEARYRRSQQTPSTRRTAVLSWNPPILPRPAIIN